MNEMNENDVLGFDPSQLTVFDETAPKPTGNANIYYTRPAESKSKDHVYRSTIRVIYNPFNRADSVLEQQSYSMQDMNGYFSVVSSLTVNDTNCPIFKAWKKCHFAKQKDGSFKTDFDKKLWLQAAKKEDGGYELFDKRFGRYVTIQVVKDKNQEELEGKYMLWKMPKAVWDVILGKMKPAKESGKTAIPVMDFLFGRTIDLEVRPGSDDPNDINYKRKTSYQCEISEDVSSCTNPDGSPLLNDEETKILNNYVDAMTPIWKLKGEDTDETRKEMIATVNADPNTKELSAIYLKVIENIKTFCPDLIEVLGYHPWSEQVTQRVQNWINIILSGNDPLSINPAVQGANQPAQAENVNTVQQPSQPDPVFNDSNDDDDLPF